MNITELIVSFIHQGHVVEMPGIGTLSGSHQPARMDGATQTFHAEQNAVTFSPETTGNNDIVKYLAEVECVDMKIAQMMWKNYLDALTDKLNRTGSHQLTGLGELRLASGVFQFQAEAETAPSADPGVIADVKHYESEQNDPFAVFDAPAEEPEPEPAPEPAPEPIATKPEPLPEPEPEPESEPTPEPEPEPQAKEPEPVVETLPEPEPVLEAPAPVEKKTSEIADKQDIFAGIAEAQPPVEEKKKRHRLLWLWLLLLILLLLGGGYYYYTHYYHTVSTPSVATAPQEENDTDQAARQGFTYEELVNIFTFNTDLLEFTADDHTANRNEILRNMQEYWSQFLSSRHYSHAMPYLQEAVSDYISQRLSQLLDHEGYSVQRFFHFDDFLHNFFYDELKDRKASHARITIQSELMDYALLDEILRGLVEKYDLRASDVGKAAVTKTKQKPVVYSAHVEKSSKHGFDVIAGFYTSQQSAMRMASRLKGLGCDAYIIDQDHLYYVSMGSAPTRTAAEALYKQITSWYSGSVAIKQW